MTFALQIPLRFSKGQGLPRTVLLAPHHNEPSVPLWRQKGLDVYLISVTEDIAHEQAFRSRRMLNLLIMKILALQPLHGWAISQRLKQVSNDVLQVSDGSLYPALHKLEQEGWIAAEWKTSELGRRAKYYSLTRLGRKQLEKETAQWQRLSSAITQVVSLKEA